MKPAYIATQIIKRIRTGKGRVAVFLPDQDNLRMIPASQCCDWKNRVDDPSFVGIYDKCATLKMVENDVAYQFEVMK